MFDVPERLGGTQFACHFIVSDGDSLSNIQDRLEREAIGWNGKQEPVWSGVRIRSQRGKPFNSHAR